MKLYPVLVAIPLYFLLMAFEWIMLKRKSMKVYRVNDTISNISCGIISQVTGVFLKVLLVGAYSLVYENWSFIEIPISWWSYALLFLGFDFCYYWMHRLSHEVNLFWAGHVVHHQSQEFNFSVALRQSSTQILWTFFFYLPLAFLGFDPISFVTIAGLSLLYQFWIHTELIRKMPRWFEFVFNTPSHHRVHHAINDKYIDKNHSGILIIWDRLFGTFQKEEGQAVYGTTKPLNSWNPLWANFNNYWSMLTDVRKMATMKNKLLVFFGKPGQSGLVITKPGNNDKVDVGKPYDVTIGKALNTYVISHFVVLMLLTSFFFLNQDTLNLLWKLSFTIFIFFSVISFGVMLENRKWATHLEFSRLLVLLFVGSIGMSLSSHPMIIYAGFVCLGLFSIVWLWRLIPKYYC